MRAACPIGGPNFLELVQVGDSPARSYNSPGLGEIEQRWIDQRGIISDWIIQEKKGVGVIFERSLLI